MEKSSASSPTVSPTKPDSNSVDAINHLVQGKRHLLVRDYASAVSSLQEACKLLAEKYGETANECGEAYFYYGKALLELSRLENGVLGNALQGVPDDEEEDEEGGEKDSDDSAVENPEAVTGEEYQEIKRQVAEALEENARELDKISAKLASTGLDGEANARSNSDLTTDGDRSTDKNAGGGSEKVVEKMEGDVVDEEEESESKEESEDKSEDIEDESEKEDAAKPKDGCSAGTAQPGSSKSRSSDDQEEEEVSNLELAWEILELAKIIFKRQSEGNRELQLKTTDVLMKLGEVSIESDNYAQAIDDLLECLSMRLELLPVDDRLIADVYYQLGLAYSLSNAFDNAIDHFNKAIDVIQLRIDNHKKLIEGKPKENGFMSDDPIDKAWEEIRELESIIPEIRSKIEDTQDLQRNAQLSAMERLAGEPSTAAEALSSVVEKAAESPSKPVSNITHLVKRKRKSEEGEASPLDAKKLKSLEQGDEKSSRALTSQEKESKEDSLVSSESCIAQQSSANGS